MQLWSTWLPDLLPHLPGCPVAVVQHEVKRAAQAFFEGSRAWQDYSSVSPVVAGQSEVNPALSSAELSMVRVEKAWMDGRPLNVKTVDEMDAAFSDDWTTHTGSVTTIVQTEPGTVRLYPVPVADAVYGLKCRVSVKPSEASTGLPDDSAEKYREAVTMGAKARLMGYAKQPWSDPERSIVMASGFDTAISGARLNAARSFGRGRIASTPKWC